VRDLVSLLEILRCTRCIDSMLDYGDGFLRCRSCGHQYDVVEGVPVMWPDQADVRIADHEHVSNPIDEKILTWLDQLEGYSLNLGAGGTSRPLLRCIEAEYAIFRHTDVVVDAHRLPFRDDLFEAVVSFNTFEHLVSPPAAAGEIYRVLKPGGRLLLQTAFLQPLHEAPYHFYNATEFGVRNWFAAFDIERCGLTDNMSPALALAWFCMELLHYIGLEQGWEQSDVLASTTLSQWRQLWVDPNARTGLLWETVQALPEEVRSRFSAGFELEATKPARD
jgi:SAM-dependent methyltransferase